MPSYNLANEYSTLLDKRFAGKSLTEAWCGHDYSFDGVNSITVYTLGQVTIGDYSLNNSGTDGQNLHRYGTPTELGDMTNTYVLQNKKSFAATLDITNVQDQKNIKKANAVIKQVWDEQLMPMIEKYRLGVWCNGAGKTVINSTTLTKSTIIEQILTGQAHLNNKFVNRDGRVCFITETLAVQTKLASELQYNRDYTTKAIINGEIARMGGLPIVAVPDDWMPAGVEFFIKYKKASCDPMKLKKMMCHVDPPGIAGTLIEGLVRYDSFVLDNKMDGIYVYATAGAPTPTATKDTTQATAGNVILTASGSTAIKYTLDGSNPKTNPNALTYSNAIAKSDADGKLIRAYATKTGGINSGILTIAYSDIPNAT